jgi:branched-chain amino acid transport system ATP-binding protein
LSAGRTVLLVEHNLDVLEGLCDQVTVMVRGRFMAQGTYAEISGNPEVISAYLGDTL